MSYRYYNLAPGEVYHICTRGVEQRDIFRDDRDRQRFMKLLVHYLPQDIVRSFSMAQKYKQESERTKEGTGLVDLFCYCLMPNHIHLLIRENITNGTSQYMHKLLTSYAKYFNMSEERSGSLFVNPFRAILVDGDNQLLHVSRYIHLNPYVAHITNNPLKYNWYSLPEYLDKQPATTCHTSLLHNIMKPEEYKKFITDEADYARSLTDIKHLLVDYED
ncbi:MAG: transposase [bacterium]